MFEQVQSQKFYLQIVNQIRQHIAEGRLKAGDRLPPERTLAQEFGASRACIREALSALETLGLIECKSGQGNFIKVDGSEASVNGEVLKELWRSHSPYEIFEARVEIEPSLAALAAEHATEDDIAALGRHLQQLNAIGREAEVDPGKIDQYMEEDRKFHLEIARIAHNSVLFTVSAGVNLMMKEKHWRVLKRKSIEKEGNIRRFEKEHTGIFEAIRGRNADLARARIREHIEDIEKDLFEA
ncbi:MAG: FadR/GntR family transcriptional regulator [Bacillota bacterium]